MNLFLQRVNGVTSRARHSRSLNVVDLAELPGASGLCLIVAWGCVMLRISEPSANPLPSGGIEFSYLFEQESGLVFQFKNTRRDKNGSLVAELDFYALRHEDFPVLLGIQVVLSSLTSQKRLAGELRAASKNELIDWDALLLDVCRRATNTYRNDGIGREIHGIPTDEILDPAYLIKPILPENLPSVLFNDGGGLKTTVAQYLAVTVLLPYSDNPLGLIAPPKSTGVLYLDYESNQSEFRRNFSRICNGIGVEPESIPIVYREARQPVKEITQSIRADIAEHKVGFVIIDSLAQACGGNVNDNEPAIGYFSALRQLGDNVTTLTIAHTSKSEVLKDKTIFGSVFFRNYARSVWEIKKSADDGGDSVTALLINRKNNVARLADEIGLEFTFKRESITIKQSGDAIREFAQHLKLPQRILDYLDENGPQHRDDIATALSKDAGTVKTTLVRLAKASQVTSDGAGVWKLC